MESIYVPHVLDLSGLEPNQVEFHKARFEETRGVLLSALGCLPGLTEIVRTLNPETLYKVVYPDGTLLQQIKGGFFSGVFRDDHQAITAHAKFAQVSPGLTTAALAVGSQVEQISIAIQLN